MWTRAWQSADSVRGTRPRAVARPEDVDTFEESLRPHGIRELARTGRIGLRCPRNENGNRNGKEPNG